MVLPASYFSTYTSKTTRHETVESTPLLAFFGYPPLPSTLPSLSLDSSPRQQLLPAIKLTKLE